MKSESAIRARKEFLEAQFDAAIRLKQFKIAREVEIRLNELNGVLDA